MIARPAMSIAAPETSAKDVMRFRPGVTV